MNEELPAGELAGRYRAGATIDELAALYRSYPCRIRRTLVAAGMEIRPSGPPACGLDRDPRGRGVRAVRQPVGELAGRYRAGASLEDLAILCGCAANKVRRILIAAGVEIRLRSGVKPMMEAPHPAPPVTSLQRRAGRLSDQAAHDLLRTGELAGRYRAGASLEDLAIEYRCSPNKIRSLLFRAGVEVRTPGRKPATTVRRRDDGSPAASLPVGELAARYQAGATLIELAVLCACSSTTIRAILIAAGVEMRPLGRPAHRASARNKP